MKHHHYFLAMAFAMVLFSCGSPKVFTTHIDTSKTPWTHLRFNNDPKNFQFALISDRTGGNRPGIFEDGIKKLNLMQPEFVINIGDLLPGYTTDTTQIRKDWEEINGIIAKLTMPFFYLPGNHDITNSTMGKVWEERFGSRYYSFVYKNCLFVIMDSNDDHNYNLSRKQTDYVINTIRKNEKARWTFLLVHHPIWKYNTDGRFDEIEQVLKGRDYTVFAGHEHQYHQTERKGSNYYILSTTGGGSNLRGNYFGEFDHISWITLTEKGPVLANLRLDGILPHNISNEQTSKDAKPMLENTALNHVVLCNKGEKFQHGTCYFSFKNSSTSNLEVHLGFIQQNQLKLDQPDQTVIVAAGTNKVIAVSFSSDSPLSYKEIDPMNFFWEMKYLNPNYPGFALQGKSAIEVKATETTFIDKEVNDFVGKTTIRFDHPYSDLETLVRVNETPEVQMIDPFEISEPTKISLVLRNKKGESSLEETRNFVRTDFQLPCQALKVSPGLAYNYYEGDWTIFPDLSQLQAKQNGIANNLMVQDISRRDRNWALEFSGFLNVPKDDLYCFKVRAEDGCRLMINDQMVVDEHSLVKGENVGAVALRTGYHKIKIEFLEKSGRPRLRIQLKNPGEEEWKNLDFGMLTH